MLSSGLDWEDTSCPHRFSCPLPFVLCDMTLFHHVLLPWWLTSRIGLTAMRIKWKNGLCLLLIRFSFARFKNTNHGMENYCYSREQIHIFHEWHRYKILTEIEPTGYCYQEFVRYSVAKSKDNEHLRKIMKRNSGQHEDIRWWVTNLEKLWDANRAKQFKQWWLHSSQLRLEENLQIDK